MYTLISKEKADTLYKSLQSVHVLSAIYYSDDFEKYSQVMVSAIVETVGQLVNDIKDKPNFSQELMKQELTEGMNACLENKALTDEFGDFWLAREDRLVKVVETIAEGMMTKLIHDYQAINN